ncbi:Ff.00g036130.m01.CDS01 [Fusarium sp. VM40]|nr:Ff.00g036130.m01.CDS01 [Fusarium sp. VM40]
MHSFSKVIVLALAILHVAGRKLDDVPQDPSSIDEASAIIHSFGYSGDARNENEDARNKIPLVERWRQWVRRQDTTETSGDQTTTEEKSATQQTTEKETTTEDKPTTTDEPQSTTEEPTTEEPTTEPSSTQEPTSSTAQSTSTETSTETSTDPTSTTSTTLASTKVGASCYSTTVSTTVVCTITTAGRTESASCITNRMTSSTCAPGLFCEIHPDSGATVCMEQHNDIGTEGIVVAAFFGVCIAGCIAVMVGMCLRDKRAQKKFETLKRARTLRTAKREERARLMAGGGQ